MTTLYHKQVFMPATIAKLEQRVCDLGVKTKHAIQEAANDRFGALQIPNSISFSGRDVIEAEHDGRRFCKLLVRLSYDATRDALYAIGIDDKGWPFLKTVWSNLKTDSHRTLDRSKYAVK